MEEVAGGLFSYRTPKDLFEKTKRDWVIYLADASDDHLLNLVFTLFHLRDWIRPKRGFSDRKATIFYQELHNNSSYQLIKKVCNNAKHFKNKIEVATTVLDGFRVGINNCTDSLDVRNHMVGNQSLREAAREVYRLYYLYFEGSE